MGIQGEIAQNEGYLMTTFRTKGRGRNRRVYPVTRSRIRKSKKSISLPNDDNPRAGAKFTKFDPITGLTWIWYGGHMVHGYALNRPDKPERDVINVGDFAKDSATLAEVRKGVVNKIQYDREEFVNSLSPAEKEHIEKVMRREHK